jgi:hypothetical protein
LPFRLRGVAVRFRQNKLQRQTRINANPRFYGLALRVTYSDALPSPELFFPSTPHLSPERLRSGQNMESVPRGYAVLLQTLEHLQILCANESRLGFASRLQDHAGLAISDFVDEARKCVLRMGDAGFF